jgi:hypothetical protein
MEAGRRAQPLPDRRRALLTAALGFLQLPQQGRALAALHSWLDTWTGVGLIVVGMERQGDRLSLRKIDDAWIAQFTSDPMLASSGFGSGPTPWRAVQQAAWRAVRRPHI